MRLAKRTQKNLEKDAKPLKRLEELEREAEANNYGTFTVPPEVMDDLRRVPLGNMTIEQVRTLVDGIKNLEKLGRNAQTYIMNRDGREFNATVTDLVSEATANVKQDKVKKPEVYLGERSRGKDPESSGWAKSMMASLTAVETIAVLLDGARDPADIANGSWYQAMVASLNEAHDAKVRLAGEAMAILEAAFATIPKNELNAWYKDEDIPGVPFPMNKVTQVLVMLQSGTLDNLRDLNFTMDKMSPGWNQDNTQSVIDNLEDHEVEFAQEVWRSLGTFFEPLKREHHLLEGTDLKKVPGIPVQTSKGTIMGEYFPIILDPNLLDGQAGMNAEQRAKLMMDQYSPHPKVRARAAHNRIGATLPVKLDLFGTLSAHFSEAAHYATHAVAIRDLVKLTYDPRIKTSVTRSLGKAYYEQMIARVKTVANSRGIDSVGTNGWQKAFMYAKGGTTLMALGGNVVVGTLQQLSVSQAAEMIGARWVARGYWQLVPNLMANVRAINAAAPMMAARYHNWERDISPRQNKWLRTWGQKTKDNIDTFAFIMIHANDTMAAYSVWMGAYDKAKKSHNMTDKQAIEFANMIVRRTQPIFTPKDVPAMLSSKNPAWKAITMFYSFFNRVYQQGWLIAKKTARGKELPAPATVLRFLIYTAMAQPLLAHALRGREWPWEEEAAGRYAASVPLFWLGTIPGLRDVASALGSGFGASPTPLASVYEASVRFARTTNKTVQAAFSDDDQVDWDRFARSGIEFVGYAGRLPVRPVIRFIKGLGHLDEHGYQDWWYTTRNLLLTPSAQNRLEDKR